MRIIHTSSSFKSASGANIRHPLTLLWGFMAFAFTPCFFMVRRRFCDSLFRVPMSSTVRLCARANRCNNRSVGLIFIRSVHHRKFRVGGMYPRPMTLTQNVWSTAGSVIVVVNGSAARRAALSIRFKLFFKCRTTRGDSTSVSLPITWTARWRSRAGTFATASHTSCRSNVESFPPE